MKRATIPSALLGAALTAASLGAATVTAPAAHAAEPQLVLNAKATLAGGQGAHYQVLVNGVVAGSGTITSTGYADVVVPLETDATAGDDVAVWFDNDAVVDGADRNLYVDHVTLSDGTTRGYADALVDYGSGWAGVTDGVGTQTGSRALWGDGAMRWSPVPVAGNVPTDRPAALAQGVRLYADTSETPASVAYERASAADKPYVSVLVRTPTASWYDGVTGNGKPEDGDNAADNLRWMQNYLERARTSGAVPQIVLYGIPGRDCGNHSAGGQADATSYRAWVDKVSALVGATRVVVIVEPDAISYCGKDSVRAEWAPLLTYVGQKFKTANPGAALYLHAGSGQLTQDNAANAVIDAGIANMRGFAVNVAGLSSTANAERWSNAFVRTLANKGVGGMHYVVDTARSGLDHPSNPDSDYNSCNNANAAAGPAPTTQVPWAMEDAYLWIKGASASDGAKCHLVKNDAGQFVRADGSVITATDWPTIKAEGVGADPASGTPYPELAAAVVRNGVRIGTVASSALG